MTDKERLENMSPIGFDLNGDLLLKSEDYHWLMEQAERVEELEEGVKEAISAIEDISPHEAKKTLMDLIKNMEGESR